MTSLLVIRHAATDWNELALIQGRTDRPLSSAGRAWAAHARLPEGWLDAHCLASPLGRTMETARLLGLDPITEPRLIEMDWGSWEGRNLAALRDEVGEAMAENEARGLDFRAPGGESPRDMQARLVPLLAEIAIPTVAITHKGVLRALYALATGWDMRDKPPEKLTAGCAHLFELGDGASLSVARLNIALERR